jgi:hypothetical protein
MMAITQQWLTLLLAHIDSVGQAERILAAISILDRLKFPSPAVLEHLGDTKAALEVIQPKADRKESTGIDQNEAIELLKATISKLENSTMSISGSDVDEDTRSLQAVSMMVQAELSSGFRRIQEYIREMNHAFDKLTADLVWEYQSTNP